MKSFNQFVNESKERLLYSAIILDKKSRSILLEKISNGIPEDWQTIAHHMTISLNKEVENKKDIGRRITLTATDIGFNDMAMAVKVSGYKVESGIPHITIAINPQGGKPAMSKDIKDWKPIKPFKLTGTIQEITNKNMKSFESFINEDVAGYSEKDVTGLHKAKPGDFIEIGIEGERNKQRSKISKIVSNNRLQDDEGNIFDRTGIIYRKKGQWVKLRGNKIISARQITLAEYKESILQFVNSQLQNFNYTKLPIEKILEIGKILNRGFPQLEELK